MKNLEEKHKFLIQKINEIDKNNFLDVCYKKMMQSKNIKEKKDLFELIYLNYKKIKINSDFMQILFNKEKINIEKYKEEENKNLNIQKFINKIKNITLKIIKELPVENKEYEIKLEEYLLSELCKENEYIKEEEPLVFNDENVKNLYLNNLKFIIFDKLNLINLLHKYCYEALLLHFFSFYNSKINILEFIKTKKSFNNKIILFYFKYNKIKEVDFIYEIYINNINNNNKFILDIINLAIENNSDLIKNNKIIKIIEEVIILFINTNEEYREITKLINLINKNLLTHFINLIKIININFINKNKGLRFLIEIINYITLPEYINLIENIKIEKHYLIFKKIKNIDIDTIISIYKNIKKEEEKYFLISLPSLVTYCSDHYNNINKLISIFIENIEDFNILIIKSIENLILSHKKNIKENLILGNAINKEESKKILKIINESNLLPSLLNFYLNKENKENEEILHELIEMNKNSSSFIFNKNMINILMENIKNEDKGFINKEFFFIDFSSEDHLYNLNRFNSLRLLYYFIEYTEINSLFILHLADLLKSNIEYKKLIYLILFKIVFYNKFDDMNLLKEIFLEKSLKTKDNSSKNRIKFLFFILKKTSDTDFVDNFYDEFFYLINEGNIKCRKYLSDEVLNEITFKAVEENLKNKNCIDSDLHFFNSLLKNLSSQNNSSVIYSLNVFLIILEKYPFYFHKEKLNLLFSELKKIIFNFKKNCEIVLEIFLFYLKMDLFVNEIFSIVKTISEIKTKNKKIFFYLKLLIESLKKKNIKLEIKMKKILRYKNKGGKYKKIDIKIKR